MTAADRPCVPAVARPQHAHLRLLAGGMSIVHAVPFLPREEIVPPTTNASVGENDHVAQRGVAQRGDADRRARQVSNPARRRLRLRAGPHAFGASLRKNERADLARTVRRDVKPRLKVNAVS